MLTDPTLSSDTTIGEIATRTPMTRRQFLRTMTVGSIALAGGAALAACGSNGSGSNTVNLTFYTAGWPFGPMPAKADIAKSSLTKAYADSLQRWLDKNPGISVKLSSANIWDMQQLNTAITAGTAPTWYPADVLGGWNPPQVLAALARGLSADVTDLTTKYNIEGELADYAAAWWQHKKVYGKYYVGPFAVNGGVGIYYRRDWFQQAGLEEPKTSWTWNDFRQYAKALTKGKAHGAALQNWAINQVVGANQQGLLTTIPSPHTNWPWRFDYLSELSEWQQLAQLERDMYFQDKTILSQPNWGDGDTTAAFAREDAAMMLNSCIYYTQPPESASNVVQLATKHNKPVEELVGFISLPIGTNGATIPVQSQMDTVAFDPHLGRNQAALAKVFDLYHYFVLGQGYIDQKVGSYQATKDLRRVYDSVTPLKTQFLHISGIPGTIEDAWGPKYVQMVEIDAKLPLVPQTAWYFPPEQHAGMTGSADGDANNALPFSQKDIKSVYTTLQNVKNQQAATLSSSVSQADFTAAAKKYYAAHSDFWQKYAPTFYDNEYKPFYEQRILPVLGS